MVDPAGLQLGEASMAPHGLLKHAPQGCTLTLPTPLFRDQHFLQMILLVLELAAESACGSAGWRMSSWQPVLCVLQDPRQGPSWDLGVVYFLNLKEPSLGTECLRSEDIVTTLSLEQALPSVPPVYPLTSFPALIT